MHLLVTGGCGFIGSNFVLDWLQENAGPLVNIDKLSYAGQTINLQDINHHKDYTFVHGNINDRVLVADTLNTHKPESIIHFAAESHVDRSITTPEDFLINNVVGTFNLLEETLKFWKTLKGDKKDRFKFVHISTDEVYGSLQPNDDPFNENTPYKPNSPYAASKASADHFVRAYYKTYGLPTIIVHSSNIYGPRQYPEKLIPVMIRQALSGQPLPVYGDGKNVRDWLYVGDAVAALKLIVRHGNVGEVYNIGGKQEQSNLHVVKVLCQILQQKVPHSDIPSYESLINFVQDRPGHDFRYAINAQKVEQQLGWQPHTSFDEGLHNTVNWYVDQWHDSFEKSVS